MICQPVSILVPTFNRLALLVKCLDALFATPLTMSDEVIIWNNCSTDGTKQFLSKIYDNYKNICKIEIVNYPENIGLSAVNRGFKGMRNFFRMKIDDDVIKIPYLFKEKLIRVFEDIETAGYIAAELENDKDRLPQQFFTNYNNPQIYKRETINDIPLRLGDASGGFCMTTEDVFNTVGGFVEMEKDDIKYFNEDSDYSAKCRQKGLIVGFLEGLKVFHAFGETFNHPYIEDWKKKYCSWLWQPGIRHRSREEKKNLLLAFSVSDTMSEVILNEFEEKYAISS